MQNKRGQGLSTNAIILIILGVVILVVLIIGFTLGWGALKDRLGGGENVDKVSQACNTACSTQSVYDFCLKKRELKADQTLQDVTCYYLSKEQTKYGVNSCPEISCDNVVFVSLAEGESLQDKCSGNEGKIVQALVDKKLESYECPASTPTE